MRVVSLLAAAISATAIEACQYPTLPSPHPSPSPSTVPSPAPSPSASPTPGPSATPVAANCALVNETIKLQWGAFSFPRSGTFVTENHYATADETFAPGNSLFPDTVTENITTHLQESCNLLRTTYGFSTLSASCSEVYLSRDENEWTPPENGLAGQAAVGDLRPTPIQEMWQGNFMYAAGAIPPAGTKYIVTYPGSGKSVVVSFGFEVGPASSADLGGLTTEVHWYLGDGKVNTAQLTIGRAADQTLPYGPVSCAD